MHRLYYIVKRCIWILGFSLCLTSCRNPGEIYPLRDSEAVEPEMLSENPEESEPVTQAEEAEAKPEKLYVYICGQVQTPGVYTLDPGSRICDVIELAGGLLEDADDCAVNQAEQVTDGRKIYIPAAGEVLLTETQAYGGGADGRISINRATKEELMTLPGIGTSKAERIIEYRETQGGFSTIEELMNIPGIKEGVFQNIQNYITVE